ncbi:outer membrane protein assembly factor BamB family protein [Lignipirellula cremea]|uniref:outer membrane protein assembly factor BamB family protein n=1 Tax=Lignipirellula cremea TaxID=2528010 RepID=UPI0018D212C7|nr:PQQ-binding-like beta-propeller repeat protein [Lignipirellula cremea]
MLRNSSKYLPVAALAVIFCCVCPSAQAENWPGWRGLDGNGVSHETNVPTQWDAVKNENIAWKTELPGDGYSSPVVWEDRVFVTSCKLETEERVLTCLDRLTGEILWNRTVLKSPLESKHSQNSYASGTPVTDGKTVFVSFLEVDGKEVPAPNVGKSRNITPGRMAVAAYDFDGKLKWLKYPGPFVSAHGFSSCPVLYKNMVIVNGDHDGKSYVVALDQETGEEIWKTPREYGIRSYVTPMIREIEGRTQMVFSGSKRVVSLDPNNGEVHWKIEGPTEQFVASMVYDDGLFYMSAGFPTHHVMAIDPTGSGDVTDTHVVWHETNAKCYVPSPVVVGDYLLVADDRGTGNCYNKKTGERLWQERLAPHYHASLVAAQGLAYFVDDDGLTKVVKPGPELEVVAENPLGEFCSSSPAISQGQIFLRGEKHLFCIGKSADSK